MYRVCDQCGGVDEHPRHTFSGVIPDAHPVNEVLKEVVSKNLEDLVDAGKISIMDAVRIGGEFADTANTERHIDCCAAAGCPKAGTVDGCDKRVAVWDGKTGAGMVEAAMKVREANAEHYTAKEA